VLVVGAGPAGSACAQAAGAPRLEVLLVDQHDFPRDKVCGDGLIPDAHAALRRLGVHDEVMAQARRVPHVRCIGPRGGHVDVPGTPGGAAALQLDDILVRAASGPARGCCTPARFEAPLLEAATACVGALLKTGGASHETCARAGWCWPPAPCRRR
jgi:2-polyprenyl-6-methoxyphenol hydroxylase-like FAD-dependent oxidoreductase